MIRNSFNNGWEMVASTGNLLGALMGAPEERHAVTLPYDSLLEQQRTPQAPAQAGYYPATTCTLVKRFDAPAEWEDKTVILEFEGVYTNSMVYLNGDYAGGCPHGYTNFYIEAGPFLKYGAANELKVLCKTCEDTRWYSGVGIYRGVKILVSELVHIVPDSYRVAAPEVDEDGATVEVSFAVENRGHKTVATSVTTVLTDAEGRQVGRRESTLTAFAGAPQTVRQRIYVENAKRWDIDAPYLYTASTRLESGGTALDEERTPFGIRTLALDPVHGLRINGKTVKLRGACVHHDNGILGAAAVERAEERRVQLLKEAGFNAVRSAHNPISKAFLDACDRVGMVVMDEVSDMWTRGKNPYDFAAAFPYYWETVCERIVAKDYNHPSVVLYSIGNEIPETGTPHGAAIGRKLAEKIRSLDESRYVMNSINTMLAVMDKMKDLLGGKMGGEINETMNNAGDMMAQLNDSELVTAATKESYDCLDACGYNYATSRYALDKRLFPNRVLVGSETKPAQIAENWAEITKYPHAIGDFTWTGWDYLGESGIGKIEYAEDGATPGFMGEYPWFIGYCGDLDITGLRRPISYYREIVFGLRQEPYIAVEYPKHYGKTPIMGMWSFVDAIGSWSWKGYEGKPVRVHVFGCGDSFALLCNGREVGGGALKEFRGAADIVYEPGELTAVVYKDGAEASRTVLRSAQGPVHLELKADRGVIRANDTDLCYVDITLRGENGVVDNMADRRVTAAVTGAGRLAGLGTGNPTSEENFLAGAYTTFDGRALAVVRPTGCGEITLTVQAEGLEAKSLTIRAE